MSEPTRDWDHEVCQWCEHTALEHAPSRPDGSMPCSKCSCFAYCLPLSYFDRKKAEKPE